MKMLKETFFVPTFHIPVLNNQMIIKFELVNYENLRLTLDIFTTFFNEPTIATPAILFTEIYTDSSR